MSLSAAVTRILTLSGFPPELKTRDIQTAFSDYEGERGGFKIKWVNDTTLMLVFMDALTAKHAYLTTLFQPPATLVAGSRKIVIKPYDGPDAQNIIQNVNSRTGNARGHSGRQNSVAISGGVSLNGTHKRGASYASGGAGSLGRTTGLDVAAANGLGNGVREPSPTLPSLPSHPTLGALFNSALNDLTPPGEVGDSAFDPTGTAAAPKVGDPARRMVGHALGIRHPGINKSEAPVKELGGLAITAE